MCRKFPLDDLKTVGGDCDTTFHQQTNKLLTTPLPALTPNLVGGIIIVCPSNTITCYYAIFLEHEIQVCRK